MSEKNNKNLKNGWRIVKLVDVVENINNFFDRDGDAEVRYVAGEHIDEGHLRVGRYGLTSDDLVPPTFNRLFKAGDVLFHSRNIRKLAQPDFDGLTGEKLFVLRTKDEELLMQDFLPFLLQTERFGNYVRDRWAGSTNKFLNKTPLMAYDFALPPKEEQRDLLRRFVASNQLVESYQEASKAIVAARQSFLAYAFRHDPLSSKEGADAESVRRLDELAEIRTGLALGKKHSAKDVVSRPYLRVANVLEGALDLTEIKTVEVRADELQRYELLDGDVLMTEGGDFDKLGRGTVWCGQIAGCLHQNHVFAVRPDKSLLLPAYLAAMARSPYGKRYFLSCAKKTSNLASINKKQLSSFPVLWTSMNAQVQAAEQVAAYDLAEQKLNQRLAAAKLLTSGLVNASLGSHP